MLYGSSSCNPMKSIYIGVCKTRDDERFKESFRNFTNDISSKYSICLSVIRDEFLPDAQNKLARQCLDHGYDYLLLLDDDHWGHTVEMLDCLINANALMATMKSYSRHYPYSCTLMKNINRIYAGIENGQGYQECDMTGFPMTLIKKELFEKIEAPYFRGRNDGGRDWATDREFCERIRNYGIKPVGCFQHCLSHVDITQENVQERRYKERVENNNIALHYLFLKRQKQLQGA